MPTIAIGIDGEDNTVILAQGTYKDVLNSVFHLKKSKIYKTIILYRWTSQLKNGKFVSKQEEFI